MSGLEARAHAASLARIARAIDRIPATLHKRMGIEFRSWGQDWEDKVRGRFVAGGDSNLHNRTGLLQRSVRFKVEGGSPSDLKLRNFTAGVIYARLQERGGVVKPVRGRFLAIPMPANLTAAGVARYPSPRAFIESHPGETFWLRTPKGELLLMWSQPTKAARGSVKARRGVAIPMWRMVRSVEIPGPAAPNKRRASRFGFFDSWSELAPKRRNALVRVARDLARAG